MHFSIYGSCRGLSCLTVLLALAGGCLPHGYSGPGKQAFTFPQRGELCLLWYNCENFFHPSDAPLSADDAFTPGGERHWTRERYERKLLAVARIIVAAGRGEPPEVVGLGEIEEGRVLEDLVAHPLIRPYGYGYLHREGPDHRGMEVACLVREDALEKLDWRHVAPPSGGLDSTRELLLLSCTTAGGRKMELVFLHLVSRYRGAGASAALRRTQVEALGRLMDSLQQDNPSGLVVAGGDFNAQEGDWSVSAVSPRALPPAASSRGSYSYRGQWSLIDYFLVSGKAKGRETGAWVMDLPALLCEDEVYGGLKPCRTYEAFTYRGGPSDHLPVVLDISW